MDERSNSRHVVLLGVGHTNAHVARMWGMNPVPDADLTCISNHSVATYSGFLPAVLAGQKTVEEMEIDLVRLCSSVGARLLTNEVVGLNHNRNEVLFADRPAVPFDVLSIGIGSVPAVGNVQVESDSLVMIKPMQTFLQRLSETVDRVGDSPLHVVIVGGGVAGIEVGFCLPGFLKQLGQQSLELSVITGSDRPAPELAAGTRRRVVAELSRRRVNVVTGRRVTRVLDGEVELNDQTRVPAHLVIWAADAVAPPLLAKLDLPLDDRGFLATDMTLRSTSGQSVFAVGDTGTIVGESLPKAGVYAVRQGPILWENISLQLNNQPLTPYQPQRSFLKLINKGNGTAIGQWRNFSFEGKWVMQFKDRIDSRFMEKYEPKPMMNADDPMQCRGCGCKLGASDLESALASHDVQLEDAAEIDDSEFVASTDFFTSPFNDAYLVGRVAALHSASDIVCTGASVNTALANVVLPEGDTRTQQRTLADFLAGAKLEFDAMGGKIVGGHTIVGPRMEVGFTVIGRQLGDSLIRKANLKVSQQFYLTKSIGTGILLAAQMRSLCPAEAYNGLIESMLGRQHQVGRVAIDCGIDAGTDITGFGLAGHLIEMLHTSGVSAEVRLSDVPVLTGVDECLRVGVESSLAPANRRFDKQIDAMHYIRDSLKYPALFDPQTCGGILLGVPAEQTDRFLTGMTDLGLQPPTHIGQVIDSGGQSRLIITD